MKKRYHFGIVIALAGTLTFGYVHHFGWTVPSIEMLPESVTLPWGQTIAIHDGEAGQGEASEDVVYTETLGTITGMGALGTSNRYSGSVETQETVSVNFDSSRKLKELFVEEGEEVKAGDPLFSYDEEDIEQKLLELDLDLEEMGYDLESQKEALQELLKAKEKAKESELPQYNLTQLSAENEIRRKEYEISVKELERANLEKSKDNLIVFSEIDGIVRKINSSNAGEGNYDSYGGSQSDSAFIKILKTGDYRIRGTVNEMNRWSVYEGELVQVKPRADETLIYTGYILSIDTEPVEENNNGYYYGGSSGESSSKYYFYVQLDQENNLILGQHVIIEPYTGEEKSGPWIPTYYCVEEDGHYYVWKESEKGRLVKQEVELADWDDETMQASLISGLEMTDYIAFPEDWLTEGMSCAHTEY